jgi:hypothetical protein
MLVCDPASVARGATFPEAVAAKIVTLGELPSLP